MSAFRQSQKAPRHAHAQAGGLDVDLLPPDRARRRIERNGTGSAARDVVDADFIVIRDAGRAGMGPRPEAVSAPTPAAPPFRRLASAVIETLERQLQGLSERNFATLVAACFVLVFVFAALQALRSTEHPEIAARPLDFTHVNLTPQDRNGMRVLLVNAIVENRSSRTMPLPKVRADLVVNGQVIASTYIEPPVGTLEAGRSRGLSARVQHPGGKTPELRLSFEEAGASRS